MDERTEEKKHLLPAKKMLLLLLMIALVGAGYMVYDYLGASRSGSSSKLGEVYATSFCGRKFYVYYLEDRNGNVLMHGMSDDKPYIFEQGDTVSITFSERGLGTDKEYWTGTYDLNQNPAVLMDETAKRPVLDPLTYTRHSRFQETDLGTPYVKAKDISLHGHALWHWAMVDAEKETQWFEGSRTLPEVVQNGRMLTVYYTGYEDENYAANVDGQALCMDFDPLDGWYSHDYALYEDGTVRVEHAMDGFSNFNVLYDEWQEKKDGFVNTEPVDDPDNFYGCDMLYERAKAEVTKPYSLVTFRVDLSIGEDPRILLYEVTFWGDPEDDSSATTVYMTPDGVTTRVLDGRPYPEE